MLGLFLCLLSVGSVYAHSDHPESGQAHTLDLGVSQQKTDADNEGVKQDLLVKVAVNVHCQDPISGTLEIQTTLTDPNGVQTSKSTTLTSPDCGENKATILMQDVLYTKGMYTIVVTSTLGSASATDTHRFDPHCEGSMGPL